MGKYLLKLPKMGESIAEATITNWLKEAGDTVEIEILRNSQTITLVFDLDLRPSDV